MQQTESKKINVQTKDLLKEIPLFAQKGITEFSLHDDSFSSNKDFLLAVAQSINEYCPDLFISLPVSISAIDIKLVDAFCQLYCSLEIDFCGTEKNGTLLFDKKRYANKIALLNKESLVFGFNMSWAMQTGDTFKAFRDRLDFAISLYPNHIYFNQLEENIEAKPTGIYSSKDIDFSNGIAFACNTFYTAGRAVPWFLSVLKVLKITASSFFADFDEWQQCNNCSYVTGFNPNCVSHKEIEEMQLLFLKEKFAEKHKSSLMPVVKDIVLLNGAFSRSASDGEQSIIETSYNPDEILSPYAMDIEKFAENVCLEPNKVKVFAGASYPEYSILR